MNFDRPRQPNKTEGQASGLPPAAPSNRGSRDWLAYQMRTRCSGGR